MASTPQRQAPVKLYGHLVVLAKGTEARYPLTATTLLIGNDASCGIRANTKASQAAKVQLDAVTGHARVAALAEDEVQVDGAPVRRNDSQHLPEGSLLIINTLRLRWEPSDDPAAAGAAAGQSAIQQATPPPIPVSARHRTPSPVPEPVIVPSATTKRKLVAEEEAAPSPSRPTSAAPEEPQQRPSRAKRAKAATEAPAPAPAPKEPAPAGRARRRARPAEDAPAAAPQRTLRTRKRG